MFSWLRKLIERYAHIHQWWSCNEVIQVKTDKTCVYDMRLRQKCSRCGKIRTVKYQETTCRECGGPLCLNFVRKEPDGQLIYKPVCLNAQCTEFKK